jgi:hypothetical protein
MVATMDRGPLVALDLTLRQLDEVGDLRAGEQLRRGVRAGGDAGAAADAGGEVHRQLGLVLLTGIVVASGACRSSRWRPCRPRR